ncbi:IS4 family transposase [Saccharibacillus sacchari]|uniref:IS4 family transposase n=1 Tax=Saccharibacillus sacchari TaxID=456493 RepID=UPI0004B82FFD|nr:IS4 family transposase [Saccharibacillus sacchari]
MTKSTSFQSVLQSVFPREQLGELLTDIGYLDTARKFKVYDLFLFLAEAAHQKWSGYRDAEPRLAASGLTPVDHSTLSKKAKDVPFDLFKRLLHLAIEKCSRTVKRRIGLPKELLLVDSTQVNVGETRLPWAPLHNQKAGVKLHVAFLPEEHRLHRVTETISREHDSTHAPSVTDPDFILVADRAYGKHKRFDAYEEAEKRQFFVIRLRDNTCFQEVTPRERKKPWGGSIQRDFTCRVGSSATLTQHRFRIVHLLDPNGKPVILATNLHTHSPERIAEIYRTRWQIEVLFRWVKQHLNVKNLFGTTPNAVYGQLYTALLSYVLLQFVFKQGSQRVHPSASLTVAQFDRLLKLNRLPVEWNLYLLHGIEFPENG